MVFVTVAGTRCGECLNGIHTVDLVPSARRVLSESRKTRILSFVPQTFSLRFLAQTGKFVLHFLLFESRRTRKTRISRMRV